MRKKITISAMISLLLLAAFIVLVIGPWPAYGPGYQEADYFRHSIAAINKSVETLRQGAPDQLMAGWGIADMTPKTGVPLAGYRGRHGKPSIGIHDRLHVKALVVGDGHNMAVIIGADMLLVPENVADGVRKAIVFLPFSHKSSVFTELPGLQAVRIGDLLFIGTPGDFSGEISVAWRKWAAQEKYDLWVTSFCGSYAGYISPDKYYDEITNKEGSLAYETGLMSWCGPNQEAYFTDLMKHMVKRIGPSPPSPNSHVK